MALVLQGYIHDLSFDEECFSSCNEVQLHLIGSYLGLTVSFPAVEISFFGIVFTKKKKKNQDSIILCKMKQKRSFCLELLHISLMLKGILLSKSKNKYVQQTG